MVISCINPVECKVVDLISLSSGVLSIINASTESNVVQHVKKLNDLRSNQVVEDMQRLYDERIKSLTPNYVIIRTPINHDDLHDQLDRGLRLVRTLAERGEVNITNVLAKLKNAPFKQMLDELFDDAKQECLPAASVIASVNFGIQMALQLTKICGLVINN